VILKLTILQTERALLKSKSDAFFSNEIAPLRLKKSRKYSVQRHTRSRKCANVTISKSWV